MVEHTDRNQLRDPVPRATRHPVVNQHPGLVVGVLKVDGPNSRAVLVREQVEEVPLPTDAPLSVELVGAVQRQLGLAPVGAVLRPGQPFNVRRKRVQAAVEPGIACHAQHVAHLLGGTATRARQRHTERHRDRVRRQHQVARLRGETAVEATGECVQRRDHLGDRVRLPRRSLRVGLDQPEVRRRTGLPVPAAGACGRQRRRDRRDDSQPERVTSFQHDGVTLPAAFRFRSQVAGPFPSAGSRPD